MNLQRIFCRVLPFVLGVVVGASTLLAGSAHAQVAVIAHKAVPNGTIETSTLTDVFTLNTKNWSDGTKITVVDYKSDVASRGRFYAALGTSFPDMQKTWLRKQFSGKASPPLLLPSEDEVVTKIAATPGAIGYVSADKVTKEVKVIATIK